MGNARVFISSVFDHRLKDPWGGDMLRGGSQIRPLWGMTLMGMNDRRGASSCNRVDDTFVCGGENMDPGEVEKMLEWRLLAIGRAPYATVS
jgi:hypothetical protein